MKSKEISFRIVLRPEPEGGYTVSVPALPGCITYGETLAEAKEMAKDAIKAYLESAKKHKDKFHDDSETLEGLLTLTYA